MTFTGAKSGAFDSNTSLDIGIFDRILRIRSDFLWVATPLTLKTPRGSKTQGQFPNFRKNYELRNEKYSIC